MTVETILKGTMKDIKTINILVISQFVNNIREFFIKNNFYEITLFNTTKYSVTNANQIKTSAGDFLRSTTEPEIWETALDFDNSDRFFCVTSLFRNEDLSSPLHKNEFMIVDFYIKNSNEKEILNIFFNLLEYLEQQLHLPQLSKLKLNQCDFEDFKIREFSSYTNSIFKVENYPLEESFYDVIDDTTTKSKKGELFFVSGNKPIEISVFGQVDENKNPLSKIENFDFKTPNIKSLNLYGMCLGIERTILCYEALMKLSDDFSN